MSAESLSDSRKRQTEAYLIPALQILIDAKGKQKKKYEYKNMMTPYDKLKSLPNAEQHLKEGVTFKKLDDIAKSMSGNQAAGQLQLQRTLLFKQIHEDCRKWA